MPLILFANNHLYLDIFLMELTNYWNDSQMTKKSRCAKVCMQVNIIQAYH